jgi:hypothetical protein
MPFCELDENKIAWCSGTQSSLKRLIDVNPLVKACQIPFSAPMAKNLDLKIIRSADNDDLTFDKIDAYYKSLTSTIILPSQLITQAEGVVAITIGGKIVMRGALVDGYQVELPKNVKLEIQGSKAYFIPMKQTRTKRVHSVISTNRFQVLASNELLERAALVSETGNYFAAVATVQTGIHMNVALESFQKGPGEDVSTRSTEELTVSKVGAGKKQVSKVAKKRTIQASDSDTETTADSNHLFNHRT